MNQEVNNVEPAKNGKKKVFIIIAIAIIVVISFSAGFVISSKLMPNNTSDTNKNSNTNTTTSKNELPEEPKEITSDNKPPITDTEKYSGDKDITVNINNKNHNLLLYFYGNYQYECCSAAEAKEDSLNSYKVELYFDNKLVTTYTSMGYGDINSAVGKTAKTFKDKTNNKDYLIYEFDNNYYIISEEGKLMLKAGISSSENQVLAIPFTDESGSPVTMDATIYNVSLGSNYLYTYKTEVDQINGKITLTTLKYEIENGSLKETLINTYRSEDSCGNEYINVAGQC